MQSTEATSSKLYTLLLYHFSPLLKSLFPQFPYISVLLRVIGRFHKVNNAPFRERFIVRQIVEMALPILRLFQFYNTFLPLIPQFFQQFGEFAPLTLTYRPVYVIIHLGKPMKKNSNSCLCISESLRQVRADMQFRANGLPRAS